MVRRRSMTSRGSCRLSGCRSSSRSGAGGGGGGAAAPPSPSACDRQRSGPRLAHCCLRCRLRPARRWRARLGAWQAPGLASAIACISTLLRWSRLRGRRNALVNWSRGCDDLARILAVKRRPWTASPVHPLHSHVDFTPSVEPTAHEGAPAGPTLHPPTAHRLSSPRCRRTETAAQHAPTTRAAMLVPPDAPAARPLPAMGRDAAPLRPEPLDPDLEARLRRQRAQQYGRMVRETLAAWHARQAARQAAEAEAKREQWEAQRARRLARLAAKQQVGAGTNGRSFLWVWERPGMPSCSRLTPHTAAAAGAAGGAGGLHAVRRHAAAPPRLQQWQRPEREVQQRAGAAGRAASGCQAAAEQRTRGAAQPTACPGGSWPGQAAGAASAAAPAASVCQGSEQGAWRSSRRACRGSHPQRCSIPACNGGRRRGGRPCGRAAGCPAGGGRRRRPLQHYQPVCAGAAADAASAAACAGGGTPGGTRSCRRSA